MKFLSLNKSYAYVLTTLLCLVFLGASYFFIYLPKNEKIVEEQRFRTLQNIDRKIHFKIDNSVNLINTIIKPYGKDSSDYIKNYINTYPTDNFILSLIVTKARSNIEKSKDSSGNSPTLKTDEVSKEITLLTAKQPAGAGSDSEVQGAVKFTFKQFVEYLPFGAVFDEYIIFSKGNTLYESFPSGIGNVREDSLLNIRNGIGGAYVRDITIGGNDYKFFLQPVTFDNKNKWVLGGLLKNSRYLQERSELPPEIILLLVTAVLAIIVVYPWIKLYQMGSKDRLTLLDGASSVVVSMLLMSLLFFCFFKYNVRVRGHSSPDSKRTLAAHISNAFYAETKNMYSVLKAYDSFRVGHRLFSNIVHLNGDNVANVDANLKTPSFNTLKDSTRSFFDSLKVPKVDRVFWADSSGVDRYDWTSASLNSPPGNFKVRSYFTNIVNHKSYYLDGDSAKRFYLDQVVSWYTGTFFSTISIPSADARRYVSVITFAMRSLQDVVLPSGYSFAIINNDGQVLYHSVSSRNLTENLKSELSDSTKLVSFLDGRSEGEFNTRYYSKNCSVGVTPIKNLPYFIVIFSDAGYKETLDIETYSFTFSMLGLIFFYIIFQLCATLLISARRSSFKKQSFDTSWVGPKKSCHEAYIIASAINLSVIFVLVFYFQKTTFLEYLFLLLFAFTFISLCLNILLLVRYKKEKKDYNRKFKERAICYISAMLVAINISAKYLLENYLHVLGIEGICIAVGALLIVLYCWSEKTAGQESFSLANRNYIQSFSLMVLTGLVITSGIPVAFFYITSFNYEQNLGIRQRQTDYDNRLLAQVGPQLDLPAKKNQPAYDTMGIYSDGSWIRTLPTVVTHDGINLHFNSPADSIRKNTSSEEDSLTSKILSLFHLIVGEKSVKTDRLYIPYAADTSVVYQPLLVNTNADTTISTYKQTNYNGSYLKSTSYNLGYKLPGTSLKNGALIYWLLLIAFLALFYFILINIIKKLFCTNLPQLELWKQLGDKIIADEVLNRLVFLIGLPGSGKLDYIKKKITSKQYKIKNGENDIPLVWDSKSEYKNNVYLADFIKIPDTGANIEKEPDWLKFQKEAFKEQYKLIIINHFDYNIKDVYTNQAKLNFLEQLMLKGKNIIILSAIHPLPFLDSMNEISRKTRDDKKPDEVKKPDSPIKLENDFERWTVLLGHYRIILVSIKHKFEKDKPRESWQQMIAGETDHTNFLREMQESTLVIAKAFKNEPDKFAKIDELALQIQVTSHYFYMYIWQSLTKEEKFLLYDLAEDYLVNGYDNYNLSMLIGKGLIIHSNGTLQLFNRGFRNFVLNGIGGTEVMKIKDRIKENGNWSKLRTPLIIVILAILAFLLISQQEAYSKLITYVAALSAGVPAVLKIFSLFDKNASKANT